MNLDITLNRTESPKVRDDGLTAEFTLVGTSGDRVRVSLTASDIGKLATTLIGLASSGRVNRSLPTDTPKTMRDAPNTIVLAGLDMVTSRTDTGFTLITETMDGKHYHIAFSPPHADWLRQAILHNAKHQRPRQN